MVSTGPTTPDEYIDSLPEDRQAAIRAVREAVRSHLPEGYEEGMAFGMIGWYVPLETFPNTYNGQPLGLASLASQKNHMALHLNNVYGDPETERWFREHWEATGRKLDMGKSCVRFRRIEDVPLDVVGEVIARTPLERFVRRYEEVRGTSRATREKAGATDD